MGSVLNTFLPGLPDNDAYAADITVYNGRLYVLSAQRLYRLNLTEDGWDPTIYFPQVYNSPNRFIEFNGKLYLYATYRGSSQCFRLNESGDEAVQVCLEFDTDGYGTMCVFEGRLYSHMISTTGASNDAMLVRLNLAEDGWEYVCDIISGTACSLSTLTSHSGTIYAHCESVGLYKMDQSHTGFDPICPALEGPYRDSIVFNGEIYFTANQQVFRLNAGEDGYDILGISGLLGYGNGQFERLVTFNNRLHVTYREYNYSGVYRLTEDETVVENLFNNPYNELYLNWVQAIGSSGDTLYLFQDRDPNTMYKYTSIEYYVRVDNNSGFSPHTVNFTADIYSDYPLISYFWDFGDSSTSSVAAPSHIYGTPGTFELSTVFSNSFESISQVIPGCVEVYDPSIIYIHNVEELQLIGSSATYPSVGRYELANDIDASATLTWNDDSGFIPIDQFKGELNGAGYTISKLNINRRGDYGVSIFRQPQNPNIYDVTLTDLYLSGTGYLGAFAGSCDTIRIANCHVSGAYDLDFYAYSVGGLVGVSGDNAIISDCSVDIAVRTPGYSNNLGGLIGYMNKGIITNCTSKFSIEGINLNPIAYVGGITAYAISLEISDCSVTLDINCVGYSIAGLVGQSSDILCSNCTVQGAIRMYSPQYVYIQDISGFINYLSGGSAINCSSSVDITINVPESGIGYISGFIGNFSGSYYGERSTLSSCYSLGDITINVRYLQNCSRFLSNISNADILDCYSKGEMSLTAPQCTYIGGLFGQISGGCTITRSHSEVNITCIGSTYSQYIGGLFGYGYFDSIVDSYSVGDVSCPGTAIYVGGFAGIMWFRDNVLRCYSLGNVIGGGPIGGFAGYANAYTSTPYTQCFSKGSVTLLSGQNPICGGFCGFLYANFLDCYATGDVVNNSEPTQDRVAGGFVGKVMGEFSLVNCYSKGAVTIS